jgi:hypothetical protein
MGLMHVSCQDGQDYDLLHFSRSIYDVIETLSILSSPKEKTFLILKFVDISTYNNFKKLLDRYVENIKLDCEEEYTLYYDYYNFSNIFKENMKNLEVNNIQHLYYSDTKQTLFEWIDISAIPHGGQAAITNSVPLQNVKSFCQKNNCVFELYSVT